MQVIFLLNIWQIIWLITSSTSKCSYSLAMEFQQQVADAWENHGLCARNELREAHRLLEQLKKKAQGSPSAVFPANALPLPLRKWYYTFHLIVRYVLNVLKNWWFLCLCDICVCADTNSLNSEKLTVHLVILSFLIFQPETLHDNW